VNLAVATHASLPWSVGMCVRVCLCAVSAADTADDLFMDKNRDSMYQDLGDLMASSGHALAAQLFEGHAQVCV
jgi:hypothetical protein